MLATDEIAETARERLLGVTILSGLTVSTGYAELTSRLTDAPPAAVIGAAVALVAGLIFKAGGVFGHFWCPTRRRVPNATAARS
ncbi:hypothetical protein ACFHW0_18160 [Micromonospora sp. LOL_025]|uniref:hypothetical protein n=1 Tax=Micromonospora sp. LOL_025 TaxID=3345413 RepID=UPI003A838DB9